ncbi:MAG TPA: carboxypeptidase regulatory-like domain-containing protein [Thermoanaerobaculia bacterium]|nr:carboxypeptidase regulatory-like domain-containing protein [Thermoanaerobaculia bacterium]
MRLARTAFAALLAICLATPLFAVWPIPTYTEYPCNGTVSPPENCSSQGGDPLRHYQRKVSDDTHSCTPVSGQFGGFCDGPGCTSIGGWCRQPEVVSATGNAQFINHQSMVKFRIEYKFPNNYCQLSPDGNVAEWPIVFNDFHQTRLYLRNSSGAVIATTMAVFEHGTWEPTVPVCGLPATFQVEALNQCGLNQVVDFTVSAGAMTPKECVLAKECPTCGMSGSPAPPGGPALPMNIGSGDVAAAVALFSIAQPPLPLSMALTYHSELPGNAQLIAEPLGHGWTHPYNQRLAPIDPAGLYLYRYTADGDEHYFQRTSPTTWTASSPGELTDTVTLVSGRYEVKDLNGTITRFDAATGAWLSTSDRWGNTISGSYTGGLLTTVTDSVGRQVQFVYTGGVLSQITLPDGTAWRFGYDANGELARIFDPLHTSTTPWRTFEYTADTRGTVRLLTAMRDDAGKLLEGHAYDGAERGVSSFTEGGRDLVTMQYNGSLPTQAVVTQTLANGQTRTATFSMIYQRGRYLPLHVTGNCFTCTNGGADNESLSFDGANHVLSRTDGSGHTTRFTYDANGNVLTKTQAFGTPNARTFTYTYGYPAWPKFITQMTETSAAKPGATKVTTAALTNNETTLTRSESGWLHAGDSAPATYTRVDTFDAHHRLLAADGPRTDVADVTTNAYYADGDADLNRRGRLQSVTDPAGLTRTLGQYDVYGTARLTTDPNGVQTLRQTDARGRIISTINKAVAGDARESADYTVIATYDGRDRLVRQTMPRGNAVAFGYEDGSNRLTDTIRIDAGGNEVERRHLTLNAIGDKLREEDQQCASPAAPCASWVTKRQEDFVYDDHDRLVQTVNAVPAGTSARYTYDPDGLLVTVQDENHTSPNIRFFHDELDRLVRIERVTAAGTVTTRYAFDAQDNLTAVTDPNGNTTTFAYDDFHRNRATNDPSSGVKSFDYNPAGLPTSMTDANGAATARTFDAAGRLLTAVSTQSGVTESVTYTYDDPTAGNYGKGRVRSVTDPTGSMTYAYERRGMVRSEQHTIQGNGYTLGYGYDANGNRSAMTYPSGRVVNYTFDFADRPLSAASNGTTFVSSAAYAPFGPETQLSFGNGTTKTATFDLRYRPVENKLTGGVGVIADYSYSEDPIGNITAIRDLTDSTYNRTFGYDELHRLTSATTGGALWGNATYAYDAMGNMTALALGAARTSSFAYNGTLPKLLSVTENGSARAVAYDAAGNELTVGANAYAYSPRNLLASGDGLSYTYDARGVRTITTVAAALGTFSGTVVTAATGAPVAGATVTVDGTLNSTTTDASGNFTLNQPGGNYTMTVVKLGFLPETTTAFTLGLGANVAVGTVRLSVAPSTITGTVVSSLGGNVAGATVALSGTTATASTDALGRFIIIQPAGTYTATITAGGYVSATTASFTTLSGQTYPLGTITLTAIPATVSGTVTSSTGGPVAGATVTAIGGPSGARAPGRFAASSTNSTTTDASGNFTLSLAAGTYSFTIAKTGFGTTTTADVTLGAGTTFSTGTIVIDPLGTITGTVVSQTTGSPVVNATVTVSGSVNSTSTDSNGRFSLQQPPGSYSIHISAAGFADTSTPFFTLAPGATHDAGTIQLPPIALAVFVGYADDLRPSANFPVPWAGAPNVVYIGTPSPLDAGAIRLDNNTDAPMPVDNVTVDLGRPGPVYSLWGSFIVPAHGSVILTQTQQFNFDTSDDPIVGCGGTLTPGDPRVPRVTVTIAGVGTTYFDTGHILDTGGFDLACRGNESLQWRLIGTTGINANGDFLLSPPTGTSQLGAPYTVTASVTDGTGQPLANVSVRFTVTEGPNRTRTGTATTDPSGHASFTYTSTIAGTDTIQATITNASGGTSTSNPVTVNWPAFSNVEVFVGYADDLRAGAAFPNPWQGSPNVVFIGNRGGDWDSGAVRIDNTGDSAITIDRVTVDLQRPGPTFSLWGSFTIPAHWSAILAQTGPGENFDTSDFPITGCGGTIAPNDPRIPKITITTAGQSASYLDTAHILDTFGYDLVCLRNESLQWRPVGSSSTADAGHLALQPLATVTPVGGNYTATAIATDAGNEPVAGLRIDFRVVTGPNSGKTGSATTNSSGIATFTYSSTLTGTDVVRASITNAAGGVLTSNDVSSTWVSTVRLTLTPATATSTVGTPYNATVLVTDGSNTPLANVFVTFRITAGPNSGKTGQAITDAAGHALFTYFSLVQGTDTIVASVVGSGGNSILSNNVSSIWVAPMAITLEPSTATTPIGASYTATAYVSTGGSPSSGAPVVFTIVAGPNAGRTQSATTDGTGHATFTYTSNTIGSDVLEAKTGSLTSNQVVAKWVAVPTILTYTGDIAGETNDAMTLSARLTEATTSAPIAGQTLAFTFGGTAYSATTDSNGTARVTVTPHMIPGAVPLSIAFTASGSYTGSSLSLFVNVVRDESAIRYTGKTVVANGTAQTLTALLTDPDGGEPLTGRLVTFTIGALTATATTNSSGIASATVTVPPSLGTGPIRLTASFAGDTYNVPASTSVPVILYQPQSFVIWGGNAVAPHTGDRVQFWGSQWDKQVTGGDYDNKADFKGWSVPAGSPITLCEATVKATGACWSSKPGQSFPPAAIERYISVIVSTSIGQTKGDIAGNIAATVVVRVDPVPQYGNDPGKQGYGTIVAVIDDGAHLFSTATQRKAADAMPFFFRHLTRPRPAQIASLLHPDVAGYAISSELARTSVLVPAPMTVAQGSRRYSFYSPELDLVAETALSPSGAPAIAYEYLWFNGHPVAQVDAGGATHWTFTDHLGTPLLLTNTDGSTYWRAEYEPFGAVYALRSADVHQPLRLPGQEAEQLNLGANGVTERSYNIHRWYRSGWGRYSQVDPLTPDGNNEYAYADGGPVNASDPDGLMTFTWVWGPGGAKKTLNLAAMCKYAPTKVSCTNFNKAKVDCTCLCISPTQWAPQIILFLDVDMYVYAGNITKGMAKDPTIHDFATAVAHEVDKHLKPAAQDIENYFNSWVKDQPTQADCNKTCTQVKSMQKTINNMYKKALDDTKKND